MPSKKTIIFPYMLARVAGLPFSKLKEFRLEEEKNYEEQLVLMQERLKKISHSEILLKGIVQTSESFFERVIKFQNKPINSFRKKEFQTQRSLFQYLSRTVGKTSPFSTLTTLSPFVLENNVFRSIESNVPKSNVQYNNQLFLEIKNWIFEETDIRKHLNLLINPTLQKSKEDFLFIVNKNEGEQLQKIETNAVIELIIEKITPLKSFQKLLEELIQEVDAEESDLINYILQLIDLGFINFEFPDFKGAIDKEERWLEWINSFPMFEKKEGVISLFSFLVKSKKTFLNSNSIERIEVKRRVLRKLNDLSFDEIPSKYLFYEDVGTANDFTLSQKDIEPILVLTSRLAAVLKPLVYDKMKSHVFSFFEKKEGNIQRMDLLNFYEEFFQQDINESEIYQKQIKESNNLLKDELEKILQIDEEGNVNLTLNELNVILSNDQSEKPSTQFLSGHFQFFKEGNSCKAILNGITPGHGKSFGRFTDFFPTIILQDLKKWNQGDDENEIWIQNDDSTVFNANSPNCFLKSKINIGDSFLPTNENFCINNLEIRWNAELRNLTLWDKNLNKKVKVFDTGVVEPSQRSKMFQLLKIFGVPFISKTILADLVNKLLKENSSFQNIPRITIDGKLIVQRKGRIIPQNLFYKKNKKDTKEDYFLKINKWRKSFLISDFSFVRIIDNENQHRNPSFYKPQLVDFKSPLSVLVFEKILNSGGDAILFSEMLPSENQLEKMEDKSYCTEFVLQWKYS